jgi:hypothetical protein
VENVDAVRRAPRRRRTRPDESKKAYSSACRCDLPAPSARDWWHVRFEDGAELHIAIEAVWNLGGCPVSSLTKLIYDFDLSVDDETQTLQAAFPFYAADGYDARSFLHAACRLAIKDYDRRQICEAGSC